MAEEVYEGAIGIDLGKLHTVISSAQKNTDGHLQVLPTHASPTMKEQMLRLVCEHVVIVRNKN